MDLLSDVLHTLRLQGALFLHAEFGAPWCVQAPSGEQLAPHLPTRSPRLAICHLVLEGGCRVWRGEGEALHLGVGDAVLFPEGEAHWLGSAAMAGPVALPHLVHPVWPDLSRIRYGGNGERTRLACAWMSYERGRAHPLLQALPAVVHSRLAQRASGAWLLPSVQCAVDEVAQGLPGAQAMGARVAESLFVEILRGFLERDAAHPAGWMMGLRDPQIGHCLALLHARPAHGWSLAGLAHEVGVSRSVLAERFRQLVGMAPMQYLACWRLLMAAQLLREPHSTVAQVCGSVGYASESAFCRAFKRRYGVAPGQWRRHDAD